MSYVVFKKIVSAFFMSFFFLVGSSQQKEDFVFGDNFKTKPKVGLVLSGGGAKGFAHIATLQLLDSLGIKVDYIGGTSVGAIIGGLYSIGYSGDELEVIVKSNNWEELLSDDFGRANLDPEYRRVYDSYFFKFSISKSGIRLPKGVSNGYSFTNFLSELTLPVYDVDSFAKYPVPFVAIATNIVNGEEVEIVSGSLSSAIRSSMAVPTFLTPVDVDSMLLLDGGLSNNFPVQNVIDMGADVIIGVDVQTDLFKKDELVSVDKILLQSIFLNSESVYQSNLNKTDILIRPNFTGYNSSSFSSVDSIYQIGKVYSNKYIGVLSHFADYLNSFDSDTLVRFNSIVDSTMKFNVLDRSEELFYVDSININGLSDLKKRKFLKSFSLSDVAKPVSINDIQLAVQKELQRNVFDDLTFNVTKSKGKGVILFLDVKEKSRGEINVGIHYDSYFNAAALLNLTYRDALFSGMLASLDMRLNETPRVEFEYLLSSRYFSTFGVKGYYNSVLYGNYDSKKENKLFETNLKQYGVDVFVGGKIGHNVYLGGGLEYEVANWKTSPVYVNDSTVFIEDSSTVSFNYYVVSEIDNRDSKYFPTSGLSLNGNLKFINVIKDNVDFLPVVYFKGRFDYYLPMFNKRLVFGNVLDFSLLTYDTQKPKLYEAKFGGMVEPGMLNFVSFTGLGLGQLSGTNGYKVRFNLQYEIFNKNFISTVFDYGNAGEFVDLFDLKNSAYGYGVSYGYNSIVGPLEVSLINSNLTNNLSLFLNFGLWF